MSIRISKSSAEDSLRLLRDSYEAFRCPNMLSFPEPQFTPSSTELCSQSTEAYLKFFRLHNPGFYRSKYFSLDNIAVQFGPWVQQLNEASEGAYVHVPVFFAVTLSESDLYLHGLDTGKTGMMFGTTSYQDYYPSGEIVIECLKYRVRGYQTVRVEFLFNLPSSIAGSIEIFFSKNLDLDRVDSLNYTVFSPLVLHFKRVFKVREGSEDYNTIFERFCKNWDRNKNSTALSISSYLPSNLGSNTSCLLEYYQDEFRFSEMEDTESNYSIYTHDTTAYGYLATKISRAKRICSNLASKHLFSFNLHGMSSRSIQNSELSVKMYSFKGHSIAVQNWSRIPDVLANKLFSHPFYVYGGNVFSLSSEVIQELIKLDHHRTEDKAHITDEKVQILFEIFAESW